MTPPKDETRATRELSPKKKKQRPAASIPRPPREERLPGVVETNPPATPQEQVYGIKGGVLARLHGIRQQHMDYLSGGWAKDEEDRKHQLRAIRAYDLGIHSLVNIETIPVQELKFLIRELQQNITDDEARIRDVDESTDTGIFFRNAINTYHEVLKEIQRRRPEAFSSEDSGIPTARPEEGTRRPYRPGTNTPLPSTELWGGQTNSLFDLNERASKAFYAIQTAFNGSITPTPGLVFDVVRSDVPTEQLEELFKIPTGLQRAQAAEEIEYKMRSALAVPDESKQIRAAPKDILSERAAGDLELAAMFDDEMTLFQKIAGTPIKGLYQIVSTIGYGVADVPFFVADVSRDVYDVKSGDVDFTRLQKRAKEAVVSYKETYSNPEDNPGYIAMDVLGIATLGAGGTARIAAAKRARAGGNSALKALARRPDPGMTEFRIGDRIEYELRFDNAFARMMQVQYHRFLQHRLDRRHADDTSRVYSDSPAPIRAYKQLFSAETKMGRLGNRRRQVELELANVYRNQLLSLARPAFFSGWVRNHLPQKLRRGLTRGEEKAIWLMATDDPDPVGLWRNFHQQMILEAVDDPVIDRKAHQRHLIDIDLAVKAMERPSERLQEAVALTRYLSERQQEIKIRQMGLRPETADARIANFARVARGEEFNPMFPAKKIVDESWYMPVVLKKHSKRQTKNPSAAIRPGEFGVAKPRPAQELHYEFTGDALRIGSFRTDTSTLVAETFGRVVRNASIIAEYERIIKSAHDVKRSEFDLPIRTKFGSAPDELKVMLRKFAEGEITKGDLALLTPDQADALKVYLHPDESMLESMDGVKWFDSRTLGDLDKHASERGLFQAVFQAINEPGRFFYIFATPRYALNALSSLGATLFNDFGSPRHIYKATKSTKLYGPKVTAAIEAMSGETKAHAYAPTDIGIARLSHGLARAWQRFTDTQFRKSAVIYWAERKGYHTREDMERLFFSEEEAVMKDRLEVSRRANKSMVEFDNLTAWEKTYFRHLIFVYPWVSRSFVWSMRTMYEHPLKTGGLMEMGRQLERRLEEEEVMPPETPDWFKKMQYFPVHTSENGVPYVSSFNSLNNFSVLADFLKQSEALSVGSPYVSFEDLLSPAAEFVVRASTGRGRDGQKYKDGYIRGAFLDMWDSAPQVSAYNRYREQSETGLPPGERPPWIPGFASTFGPLLGGQVFPKQPDWASLEFDYWKEHPEEAKIEGDKEAARRIKELGKNEMIQIRMMTDVFSKIVGRETPKEVSAYFDLQEKFTEGYRNFSLVTDGKSGEPRLPTTLERRFIEVRIAQENGLITEPQREELEKELVELAKPNPEDDGSAMDAFTTRWREGYLNHKVVQEWFEEAHLVVDVAKKAPMYVKILRDSGLAGDTNVTDNDPIMVGTRMEDGMPSLKGTGSIDPKGTRVAIGRAFAEFDRQARIRAEATANQSRLEDYFNAEERAWMDEQDKPIKVGTRTYPSVVRLDWAMRDTTSREAELADLVDGDWGTLTNFEKELLGKKVHETASQEWLMYNVIADFLRGKITREEIREHTPQYLEDIRDLDPKDPGEQELDFDTRKAIAGYVSEQFGQGFMEEFNFSEKTKVERIAGLSYFEDSPKEWKNIFNEAMQVSNYLKALRKMDESERPYKISTIEDTWDDYARQLIEWYGTPEGRKQAGPEFLRQLELVGRDLLYTLPD